MTMDDIYEALLFYDELSPERQQWVREQLETDDDLANAFAQWRRVCAHLRQRLEDDMPECRILVLYALADAGRDDLLTADEKQALSEARPRLRRALDAHPALEDVVARIQEEQADFEMLWEEHGLDLVDAGADVGPAKQPVDVPSDGTRTERTDRSPRRSPARDESRRWTRRVAVGTLVAAVVALIVFVWPSGPAPTTVQVAQGETRVVELTDGSQVRLVGDAEMQYVGESAFDRHVTLRYGRAFFDVQDDGSGTPFVVTTPTATTTVLGTQFGVEADAERTDVVLAEGRVEVGPTGEDADGPVVLSPGQRSRVERGRTPTPPERVDVTEALAWTGLFVFRTTPMRTIVDRLHAQYGVEVAVDSSLRDEAVTGTFERSQPVKQVLTAIAITLGAEVQGNAADGFKVVPQE